VNCGRGEIEYPRAWGGGSAANAPRNPCPKQDVQVVGAVGRQFYHCQLVLIFLFSHFNRLRFLTHPM